MKQTQYAIEAADLTRTFGDLMAVDARAHFSIYPADATQGLRVLSYFREEGERYWTKTTLQ